MIDFILGLVLGSMAGLLYISTDREYGEPHAMIGILISLLILAVVLWIASLILDMIVPQMGMPSQVKPIVLAIVGLIGIVSILGGYRLNW